MDQPWTGPRRQRHIAKRDGYKPLDPLPVCKKLRAKYAGHCTVCKGRYSPGDQIAWSIQRVYTAHWKCFASAAKAAVT